MVWVRVRLGGRLKDKLKERPKDKLKAKLWAFGFWAGKLWMMRK